MAFPMQCFLTQKHCSSNWHTLVWTSISPNRNLIVGGTEHPAMWLIRQRLIRGSNVRTHVSLLIWVFLLVSFLDKLSSHGAKGATESSNLPVSYSQELQQIESSFLLISSAEVLVWVCSPAQVQDNDIYGGSGDMWLTAQQ